MSTMTQGALMESLMAWQVQRLVVTKATRISRDIGEYKALQAWQMLPDFP
jgi:hypothetical protein